MGNQDISWSELTQAGASCDGSQRTASDRTRGTSTDTPPVWEKPAFKDLRFGFEVTMYIFNR